MFQLDETGIDLPYVSFHMKDGSITRLKLIKLKPLCLSTGDGYTRLMLTMTADKVVVHHKDGRVVTVKDRYHSI